MGFFEKLLNAILNAITEPIPAEHTKPVGLSNADNKTPKLENKINNEIPKSKNEIKSKKQNKKETKKELYKLIGYSAYPVKISLNKDETSTHIEDHLEKEIEGLATLYLEKDNPVSSTAIAIYIDNTKVGYLPHSQNNIYAFLQLLQNKGIALTLKYEFDEIYIPTVDKTIELLKPELKEICEELDELIRGNYTYDKVYDEEYYKFRNNLQSLALKNKNSIESYNFPVKTGRHTKQDGTPGYFSVDGVLYYWAYALIVLLNAYSELKCDYEQYENSITAYKSELILQKQIRDSYSKLNTYAAVGRKFNIKPQKIKKYIQEEIKDPSFRKYTDSDWEILNLSSFDILWQNRYMLEEWNSKWSVWDITMDDLLECI